MDERLDTAIDQVAREMTAAEPPATLRADVLARIHSDRRPTGLLMPGWAWAGAAAAIVVGGVAATLWTARPEPVREHTASAHNAASQPVSARSSTATTPDSPVTLLAEAPAQSAAQPRAARPAAVQRRVGLPDDAGPASLEGPSALEIGPLELAEIAVPELGVSALGDIAPITVSTIGPGSPEPQRRDRE